MASPDEPTPDAPACGRRPSQGRIRTWASVALLLALAAGALSRITRTGPDGDIVLQKSVHEFPIFHTYARITLWADPGTTEDAVEAAKEQLQALHKTINAFDPNSELARLNRTAAHAPFACSDALWAILQTARRAHHQTDGVFDITVGPLMKAWGFRDKREHTPSDAEIRQAMALVGLRNVRFDDDARTVHFPRDGMAFDLGGIAKGYALDILADELRARGLDQGMIDLGGNIRCLGHAPPGRDRFVIGIRDPARPQALLGTVPLLDKAVATSGNYERFVELDGRHIDHIVDPRNGQPVDTVASVTVITNRGVDSDVFSTAVFVAGPPLIERLRKRDPGITVIRVVPDEDGTPHLEHNGTIPLESPR